MANPLLMTMKEKIVGEDGSGDYGHYNDVGCVMLITTMVVAHDIALGSAGRGAFPLAVRVAHGCWPSACVCHFAL